mmetsp:Transcript_4501/g.13569  ORF Transcript_4501/g.13569 Transcript_4501/m.13569 type:complete len:307 (-) Transcript_4501:13-933(-)
MAEAIVADLRELVAAKNCGAILIRLSWHDAGVFSSGALKGGCPNAAQRFRDAGEGAFEANAGLDVAIGLLAPVAERYVAPGAISHADLWALAAGGAGICGRVSEHVPEIRVRWELAGGERRDRGHGRPADPDALRPRRRGERRGIGRFPRRPAPGRRQGRPAPPRDLPPEGLQRPGHRRFERGPHRRRLQGRALRLRWRVDGPTARLRQLVLQGPPHQDVRAGARRRDGLPAAPACLGDDHARVRPSPTRGPGVQGRRRGVRLRPGRLFPRLHVRLGPPAGARDRGPPGRALTRRRRRAGNVTSLT